MKIAVVSANTPSHKGIRGDLIKAFLERGLEVVAFGGGPEEEWGEVFRQRGHAYRQFFVNRAGVNPFQDLKTISSLRRLYEEERPDKVFTYHAKGNIYGALAAHQAGIEEVYCLVAGLGSIFRNDPDRFNIVRNIMGAEYKKALRNAKGVFFQNTDDVATFVEKGIVAPEKVTIVNGSGVDLSRFAFCEPPLLPSFLFVGRLIRDKGIVEFIDAARIVKRKHPEAEFNIVGGVDLNPTSLSDEDVECLQSEGIVNFCGEQEDVVPFYRENSIFVLPSHHEGTPRSALEAMSTGRPVILTDAPGCRDVVQDGINGLMVPVGNPEMLAQAMIRFVEHPVLISSMGKESRAIAEEKYDVNKVNEAICNTMGV